MQVSLESPLPPSWRSARAPRCSWPGRASPPASALASLVLLVDGEEQPLGAFGMPRLETLRAPRARRLPQRVLGHGARSARRRSPLGLRARFGSGARGGGRRWATIAAAPRRASRVRAAQASGRDLHDHLRPAARPVPAPGRVDPGADPRATGSAWSATTARRPERFAAIRDVLGDDPRFVLSRTPRRLGFYRNFERALALAPAAARATSRSPTRTTPGTPTSSRRCCAELGDAPPRLQRRPGGRRRRPRARRQLLGPPHATTTRPALAAGRELGHRRGLAVPAPRCSTTRSRSRPRSSRTSTTTGSRWWRCSLGDIAFVERPLYDYVQHGDATLGHAAANRMPGMRERLGARARATRASGSGCGGCTTTSTPAGCCSSTAVLRLRCWERMAPAKRRAVERFERADRSLPRARRARVARRAGAAGPPARHARRGVDARPRASRGAGCWRPPRATGRRGCAARLAAAARRSTRGRAPARRPSRRRACIAEKIAPLRWAAADDAPRAGQPADPVDRPPALLRRLHRQVQPRAAARGARRAGADRHRRPGRLAAARPGARTSRPTAGSPGCSTRSRSSSGASRRASRSAARDRLDRHHVVDRAHRRTRRCARSTPSASST